MCVRNPSSDYVFCTSGLNIPIFRILSSSVRPMYDLSRLAPQNELLVVYRRYRAIRRARE